MQFWSPSERFGRSTTLFPICWKSAIVVIQVNISESEWLIWRNERFQARRPFTRQPDSPQPNEQVHEGSIGQIAQENAVNFFLPH
jgi:hypothetical protein